MKGLSLARLLLLFALIGIALLAVSTVLGAVQKIGQPAQTGATSGDSMPDTFQRIAYVLLIVLMFGICTGWLGAV